ncbi:MAG: 3-dehydroquinate synthase [bacterium]
MAARARRGRTRAGKRADCYLQSFAVPFSYPVHFARDVFNPASPLLASVFGPPDPGRPHRLAVFVDDGVVRATPQLPARMAAYFARRRGFELLAPPEVIAGGERAKDGWHGVQHVMTQLGNLHLCRHSYVVAVGGGCLLDMVGFAASLVHRGVRLVRLPTTVLAQNDAGVGIKNGMNAHGMKNFVGTFAPPHAVIDDFAFLDTLDDAHWRGGISEAFKVAIIKDAAFFAWLDRRAARLKRRHAGDMEQLVRRCATLHLQHIGGGGDPFEQGAARPLDFGHWAAHKLESLSGFAIGHGQAVAIGIALDSHYAAARGLITAAERDRIVNAMQRAGLAICSPALATTVRGRRLAILDGLDEFREHLGGRLTLTLPSGIGERVEVHAMDERIIVQGVRWLNGLANADAKGAEGCTKNRQDLGC